MPWMPDLLAEWIETDGLGGYALGTVGGRRTRRYHGLLVVATQPPTGRMVLVNGHDAWITCDGTEVALSTQLFPPFVVAPDNSRWLDEFTTQPWPTWQFRLPTGVRIQQELFQPRGIPATVLRWRALDETTAPLKLMLRPYLSGRDHHALHHENPAFQFTAMESSQGWCWHPYPGVPAVTALSNGVFREHPLWYRQFLYETERERGLEDLEDLATPGTWTWNLAREPAVLIWTTAPHLLPNDSQSLPVTELAQRLVVSESSRRSRLSVPQRLSETYLVRTPQRTTIIAGYPWFTDWGRDTFIALRGLCLATGELETAGTILEAWANLVSEGMLPNRFPDDGAEPEFNAVDASLWFVLVVREYLDLCRRRGTGIVPEHQQQLMQAVSKILRGYSQGTRYDIHLAADGLLAAGIPGVQLTWMDAKVGDWVVTPRIGKPVEIQALWLNALAAFPDLLAETADWLARGRQSFVERFWNDELGCLHDVVDVDHQPGRIDASIRPNQLLALGALPLTLVTPEAARRALEVVETHLLTPLGLRTLSPSSPEYVGRYHGNVRQRDGAYHQGTAWPWWLGPFVEAWLTVHGSSPENLRLARERFLGPLQRHRKEAGLDHLSEIVDGDAPHSPRGCPFQAWSVGEYLRLDLQVLAEPRL